MSHLCCCRRYGRRPPPPSVAAAVIATPTHKATVVTAASASALAASSATSACFRPCCTIVSKSAVDLPEPRRLSRRALLHWLCLLKMLGYAWRTRQDGSALDMGLATLTNRSRGGGVAAPSGGRHGGGNGGVDGGGDGGGGEGGGLGGGGRGGGQGGGGKVGGKGGKGEGVARGWGTRWRRRRGRRDRSASLAPARSSRRMTVAWPEMHARIRGVCPSFSESTSPSMARSGSALFPSSHSTQLSCPFMAALRAAAPAHAPRASAPRTCD